MPVLFKRLVGIGWARVTFPRNTAGKFVQNFACCAQRLVIAFFNPVITVRLKLVIFARFACTDRDFRIRRHLFVFAALGLHDTFEFTMVDCWLKIVVTAFDATSKGN